MDRRILIIDGDHKATELLRHNLERAGYQVATATDGRAGIRLFFNQQPDLVLLETMIADFDGYAVCQRIRQVADTPIIMMSRLDDLQEMITGLDLGADDYVLKPFRMGEFLARIRAVLRWYQRPPAGFNDGYLTIDLAGNQVLVAGKRANLSRTEHKILMLLLNHKGNFMTPSEILAKVWGAGKKDRVEYVRVYIQHLRNKLERDPKHPTYIINKPNRGYRFEVQP